MDLREDAIRPYSVGWVQKVVDGSYRGGTAVGDCRQIPLQIVRSPGDTARTLTLRVAAALLLVAGSAAASQGKAVGDSPPHDRPRKRRKSFTNR